jgi:hypothetical protein
MEEEECSRRRRSVRAYSRFYSHVVSGILSQLREVRSMGLTHSGSLGSFVA